MAEAFAVKSSWVAEIRYNGGVLTVTTRDSRSFSYQIPPHVWDELQRASSKGEYINQVIKRKFKPL